METTQAKTALKFFGASAALVGIACLAWLAFIPADPKNAVVFGMSASRLAIWIAALAFEAGLVGLAAALWHGRGQPAQWVANSMQNRQITQAAGIAGILLLSLLLLSPSVTANYSAIFERIRPLLAMAAGVAFSFTLGARAMHGLRTLRPVLHPNEWKPAILIFAGLLAVMLAAAMLYPDGTREDYWFESGIPIMGWQVALSAAFGWLVGGWFEKRPRSIQNAVLVALFVAIGVIWAAQPVTPSFFNPKPGKPTGQMFPFADAADYDLQGQASLQGTLLNAGEFLDRPIYPAFLAALHAVLGQNYQTIVQAQAFFFAILPLLMFLIGRRMHSAGLGLAAYAAGFFWGLNSTRSTAILNTATPQHYLSDFPAAIALALLVWLSLRWLDDPEPSSHRSVLLGAAIGFASLIRYSLLGYLAFIPFLLMAKVGKQWAPLARTAGLLLLGFVLVLTPWNMRNALLTGRLDIPFASKISFILEHRYEDLVYEAANRDRVRATETAIAMAAAGANPTATPTAPAATDPQTKPPAEKQPKQKTAAKNWFAAHLAHNLAGNLYALPGSLFAQPYLQTLSSSQPIWQISFNGQPNPGNAVVLGIVLAVLAWGMGRQWRTHPLPAMALAAAYTGVALANSFGRTSGGRYAVPFTWVAILALLAAIFWLQNNRPTPVGAGTNLPNQKRRSRLWLACMAALAIGASPIVWENVALLTNPPPAQTSLPRLLQNNPGPAKPAEIASLQSVLAEPNAILYTGRALYPLHSHSAIAQSNIGFKTWLTQRRSIHFYLVLPHNITHVFLASDEVVPLGDAQMVTVAGCEIKNALVARGIWLHTNTGATYYPSDVDFSDCEKLTFRAVPLP